MPLRLDIKKKLNARSERVKCVDIHPTEPWVLSSLYDGNVYIYDYATQTIVKSFEVSEQPVRCGCFIPRKQWIVVGCDDMLVRVYNYNTMEKVRMFEAHMDYIRSIAVHPSLPYILTASDDMLIKLWDWEKDWFNSMIFEGHSHYVMQIKWNPKDANTFASASLDHTIKVWNLSSPVPNFTLEGHEKGVNCVDYYLGGDKPYMVTGSDDQTIKIWDYQTKACVQTLDGHTHNVSCVAFLADRPLIVSGSEDGNAILHHSNTYRMESTLNYGLDRCWSISSVKGVNKIAFGYDEGTIVIRLGKDHPIASMDSSGKVIIAKHNEVSTVNVRNIDSTNVTDGERVALPSKDLGSCEIYPQSLRHSPNGRFVAVCGDGEFIIYTAIAWRNKSYGAADEVVWDAGTGEYATRQGSSDIRIFSKSFAERQAMRPSFPVEGLYGGALVGLRAEDFICFYDWESLALIRRIDVAAREVYWSDGGNLIVLASESAFFMLKYSRDAVDEAFERTGGNIGEDGIDEAFELIQEVPERVVSGCWVGDCFLYTNGSNRLNYCVGSEMATMNHLDRQLYILGYLPKENRLFCVDKDSAVVTFKILLAVLEYKTAVVRQDLATAESILPRIPASEHNKLARFLESQGLREEAMRLATDPDFKCELAIALGQLETAAKYARQSPSEVKWGQLAGLATTKGDFALAEECMKESRDSAGLLTLGTSRGDTNTILSVAEDSASSGKMNVAFLCNFMLNRLDQCIDLLISVGRFGEAAVFARTYKPSRITEVVEAWRADLRKNGDLRAADSLADPTNHPHLFPDVEASLKTEVQAAKYSAERAALSALAYAEHKDEVGMDQLMEHLGNVTISSNGNGHAQPAVSAEAEVDAVPQAKPEVEDIAEKMEAESEPVIEANGVGIPNRPEDDEIEA